MAINFFNSLDYLEPKCGNCGIILEYGINTKFDEKKDIHVCCSCGKEIR